MTSLLHKQPNQSHHLVIVGFSAAGAFAESVKIITLDPGHFHAGLVQKSMLEGGTRRFTSLRPPDRISTAICA